MNRKKIVKFAAWGIIAALVAWGVINVCHAMSFPELPIGGNQCEDKFKIYLADSGLLLGQLDAESERDFRANRNLGMASGPAKES